MSETITIWVSDSDICEMCGGLLDWFGECPHCGYDPAVGYSWDNCDREEEYDDEELSAEEEVLFLRMYFEQEESSPTRAEGARVEG